MCTLLSFVFFFFSSRRRHTRFDCDWSSDVCSSDLAVADPRPDARAEAREPPRFLAAAAVARSAAGVDEDLRAGAAVAAREPAVPLSGRCRVRALVRAGAPGRAALRQAHAGLDRANPASVPLREGGRDRKSTRLNSSHSQISYAVFCLKKKKQN